jgi:hypothetical protein
MTDEIRRILGNMSEEEYQEKTLRMRNNFISLQNIHISKFTNVDTETESIFYWRSVTCYMLESMMKYFYNLVLYLRNNNEITTLDSLISGFNPITHYKVTEKRVSTKACENIYIYVKN